MSETAMLFPIAPTEIWKQISTAIDEVVSLEPYYQEYEVGHR